MAMKAIIAGYHQASNGGMKIWRKWREENVISLIRRRKSA